MELDPAKFKATIDGKSVGLFTLRNQNGMVVKITNYGSRIEQILVPDRNGVLADVVLGYDTIEEVQSGQSSFGAMIGRFANRIAHGRFSLDGTAYQLDVNAPPNYMHGGAHGSRFRTFDVRESTERSLLVGVRYGDREDGMPGNVDQTVRYELADDNRLTLTIEATTDKPTVVNFTDHSYFNLAGAGSGTALGHIVTIDAQRYTPQDKDGIPSGEYRDVAGTPYDFRTPVALGSRIDADETQLRNANGYDVNFVIDKPAGAFGRCARIEEPTSGRVLEVWSTQPGLQFFSANNLKGAVPKDAGKGGAVYTLHGALCAEAQHFPDSPNHPDFPSTVLRPGERFSATIAYAFSITS